MTLTPDPEEEPIEFELPENFMAGIEAIERAVAANTPVPSGPVRGPLPDTDDIGDLESRVADLSYADSDEAKVAGLRSIARWLSQWNF